MQLIILNLPATSSTHNYQLMANNESFYYEDSYFDPLSLESLLNPKPPDLPRLFNQSSRNGEEQEDAEYQRDNDSQNYPSATLSQLGTSREQSKRSSNTIFKTSLSQFRKTVLDVISKHRLFEFIQQEIDCSYRHKNQSTFPKIVAIVRQLSIDSKLEERWILRAGNLIKKKQQLSNKGKFNEKRLKQLIKSIQCMTKALQQQDFMASLDIYWGKYRQSEKYEKCKQEVSQFQEKFSLAYTKKVSELQDEKIHKQRRKGREVEKRRRNSRNKPIQFEGGSLDLRFT